MLFVSSNTNVAVRHSSMSDKDKVVEAQPFESLAFEKKPPKWYSLFGKDVSYVPVDAGYETSSETSSMNEGIVRNTNNVFEAPEAADIYKMIEGFEGAHRFDASATWTEAEEKRLVRRVRPAQCNPFRLSTLLILLTA